MQLNQPNNDQAQQNGPVILQGDTVKKDPSITLQLNTPPPQVEVKAPEPVQNQAVATDKQQLLKDNPWLAEVNKDMDYKPDFMLYAGKKRNEEKVDFNTSEKWQIFKKYYNRK